MKNATLTLTQGAGNFAPAIETNRSQSSTAISGTDATAKSARLNRLFGKCLLIVLRVSATLLLVKTVMATTELLHILNVLYASNLS